MYTLTLCFEDGTSKELHAINVWGVVALAETAIPYYNRKGKKIVEIRSEDSYNLSGCVLNHILKTEHRLDLFTL